jgi:hypothetical protein
MEYMTRDQLIKDYAAIIDKQKLEIEGLKAELEEYRSIAEKVGAQKAISEKEQWEKCADDLIDYAHGFVENVSLWEGYNRYDKKIKLAEDAIEAYNTLKKGHVCSTKK